MTRTLARACAAHPWRTIGVWLLAIVIGAVCAAAGLGGLTTEGELTNNPDSVKAKDLIEQRLPDRRTETELVVVRSNRFTVDQTAFRAEVGGWPPSAGPPARWRAPRSTTSGPTPASCPPTATPC